MRVTILFLIHILVSITILVLNLMKNDFFPHQLIILGILMFLGMSLVRHYYEIKDLSMDRGDRKRKISIKHIKMVIGAGLAAGITWYINHKVGYGAVVANGLVGVIASILFDPKEAGTFYVASFVGMSAINVIPSVGIASLAGMVAGIIVLTSQEVYAGMGGKGGTMAAFSTQFVRMILSWFV